MEFKVLMVLMLSVSLSILFMNGASLISDHQEQASYHLAEEHSFGFAAMPRKLLLNQKVEVFGDKDLVSYTVALSGQSHKGKEAAEETMEEGSDSTDLFTMDYSGVRRRRPVHNKSFPATTASP